MRIIIDIDVTNVEEVVKAHKGEWQNLLAGVLLSKSKRKKRVEQGVCAEIIKAFEVELLKGLKEEMIEANISYSIEDANEDGNLSM